MEINGIFLVDAAVQAAQKKFGRDNAQVEGATFDKLLSLFTGPYKSFRVIGKEVGISRSRVQQLYDKYFRSVLPGNPSGLGRRRAQIVEQLQLMELPSEGPLAQVAKSASDAGLEVERVSWSTNPKTPRDISATNIRVNGALCSVSHLTTVSSGVLADSQCVRASLWRSKLRRIDFKILLVEAPGFPRLIFIVPTRVFLKGWKASGANQKSFWVPVEKSPNPTGRGSFTNWWQYEGAWHLVKEMPEK